MKKIVKYIAVVCMVICANMCMEVQAESEPSVDLSGYPYWMEMSQEECSKYDNHSYYVKTYIVSCFGADDEVFAYDTGSSIGFVSRYTIEKDKWGNSDYKMRCVSKYIDKEDGVSYSDVGENWAVSMGLCDCDGYVDEKSKIISSNMLLFDSIDSVKNYVLNGDDSGLVDSFEHDISNAVDDKENIGYLQNAKVTRLTVDDKHSGYITYDKITNTGFDVSADNVKVALYTKLRMYDGTTRSEDFISERRFVDMQDTSELKCEYDVEKLQQVHSPDFAKWNNTTTCAYGSVYCCDYSMSSGGIGTQNPCVYDFEYWLKLYVRQSDGSYKMGGWLQIWNKDIPLDGDNNDSHDMNTYDNDDNEDTEGGYDDGEETKDSTGEGDTEDEAIQDAEDDTNITLDDFDLSDFKTMLESILATIQDVPKIIANVFTSLPAAIVVAISVGFLIAVILRVIGR